MLDGKSNRHPSETSTVQLGKNCSLVLFYTKLPKLQEDCTHRRCAITSSGNIEIEVEREKKLMILLQISSD